MLKSKEHAQLNETEKVPEKAEDMVRMSESVDQKFKGATVSTLRVPVEKHYQKNVKIKATLIS